MTRDDPDENWFRDMFRSSRKDSRPMSSGMVTRLFACKSSTFNFLRLYRLRMLAGEIELYDRLSVSSLSKSSGWSYGISLM